MTSEVRSESTNIDTRNLVLYNEDFCFSILSFLDERTRVNFISVTKEHSRLLTSDAAFKWRLTRLHIEHGIYFSSYMEPNMNTSWKKVFLENYLRRDLWKNANANSFASPAQKQFQLSVSARFKPKGFDVNADSVKKVSLPLHQRLQLIRMNRNITSQKEAFHVLVNQGGWFGGNVDDLDDVDEKKDDALEKDNGNEPYQDKSQQVTSGVHLIDTKSGVVVIADRTKGLRKFEFDSVFDDKMTQKQVYMTATMPLIVEFINGYNATCLVYGQTGSGKTYSMFGPNSDDKDAFKNMGVKETGEIPDSFGIVPRSIREVFHALQYRRQNLRLEMKVDLAVSYIEIYGNEVNDLLKGGRTCGQNSVSAQRSVLDGSSEVGVSSLSETLMLLDEGEKQKRKAATAMNSRSSRAHTLFIMTLRQKCTETGVSATSRLFLVDLGGSEQIKRSQPFRANGTEEGAKDAKTRVQEAVNINLGLLALKQCVESLRRKNDYIPYQDSKLTMMLSEGLGGDSKTSVVVCGAQEESHGPETISAMKFGQTCRGVYNTVKTNANMLQSLLQNIDTNIAVCEQNIRDNERWEEVDDCVYDDDGKTIIEIRKKTIVLGADTYRSELANLIRQKAELTGENLDDLLKEVRGFGDFLQYTA